MDHNDLIIQKPTFNSKKFEEGCGVLFQRSGEEPRFGIIRESNPLLIAVMTYQVDESDAGRGKRKIAPVSLLAKDVFDGAVKVRTIEVGELSF